MEPSSDTNREDDLEPEGRNESSSRINKGERSYSRASQEQAEVDDEWQRQVIETEGNICLRSGRQVGKSRTIAKKASIYAINHPKKSVMIISATERQAYLLFSKVLGYLHDNFRSSLRSGKDRPTKTEIKLKNGTIIRCLPTGLDGIGIRGYTVDLLIADEAAYIPEDVWPAVTPMLATTKGALILLSTPKGVGNFFYDCYHNPSFKTFHVSSEDCPRISKEFLENEKKRLTKLQYAQEYLGEFTDNLRQVFPDKLIKDHMTLERPPLSLPSAFYGDFSMGVDIARMGGDECTFEIFKRNDDVFYQVENYVTQNILIPQTIQRVKDFNLTYKDINKNYIDTGGMGVAVFDFLLQEMGNRVVAIDNATRPVEKDRWHNGKDVNPRKSRLMKEQLYMNAKRLLEQDRCWLLKDDEIFLSLKSVQCEYTEGGDLKIFGNYTHIAEGIIRALWYSQEKVNKVWIGYI